MKRLVVELPDDLHREVTVYAAQKEKTLKEIVTDLLIGFMKHKKPRC